MPILHESEPPLLEALYFQSKNFHLLLKYTSFQSVKDSNQNLFINSPFQQFQTNAFVVPLSISLVPKSKCLSEVGFSFLSQDLLQL